MPILPDVKVKGLGADQQEQINGIVRQLNEWGRLISAETRVRTIKGPDGSTIGMGQIPNTEEIGFFTLDPDGNLVSKWVGATLYFYDLDTGKNNIQLGVLPDDTYGLVVAKEGEDVEDIFS